MADRFAGAPKDERSDHPLSPFLSLEGFSAIPASSSSSLRTLPGAMHFLG